MEIKSTTTDKLGKVMDIIYVEDDPLNNFDGRIMDGVRAHCFCNGKFVLVHSTNNGRDHWTPPGGGIEKGENFQEAIDREIKEETNMKVLKQGMIGYLDFYKDGKILRQVIPVCIVEPYGDFVSDPDEDITEIKLIDPKDYKQYFDWGEIGDRQVAKALEMFPIL